MKIFLVASECVPFIKTGGLADVVGALPAALKKLGAEVSVLIPKYSMIPQQFRKEMQHIYAAVSDMFWFVLIPSSAVPQTNIRTFPR